MTKLMLALWAAQKAIPGEFQRALAEQWTPAAASTDGVLGLALNEADLESGERWDLGGRLGRMADAVVAIWLEDAAARALGTTLAGGGASALGPLPAPPALERVEAWRVEEHEPKPYDRDWHDGERSPGVKLVTLMRPAEGRTHAECARYWREQHTPLALRVHVGLWHYVQNVVLEALTPGADDVFGVVELHFRSRESLRDERYDSEAGRQAVREDIPRFMSLDRTQGGYFVERIVRTPRDAAPGPAA